MFGKKKMHAITEDEALAVAADLQRRLMPTGLKAAETLLAETMDRLGLAKWRRDNLAKIYDTLAGEEVSIAARVKAMRPLLGDDERAATCFCAVENVRYAIKHIALSAAEDINNANAQKFPFNCLWRHSDSDDLELLRAEAHLGLMDVGITSDDAQRYLNRFEQQLGKDLRTLGNQSQGRGR